MATATQEKNTNTVPNFVDMMMDNSLRGLSTMFWAQEQGEKFINSCIEQNKVTREQGRKMAEQMAAQVKENQRQLQNLVQSTVRMSLEAYRVPQMAMVEELNRRVEELTRQIESMKTR